MCALTSDVFSCIRTGLGVGSGGGCAFPLTPHSKRQPSCKPLSSFEKTLWPRSAKKLQSSEAKNFVWDAIRDVGAIHKRLVPGFVVDCKLEDEWRIVTFANGMVVRELIIDVDDKTCRHSWSARGEPLTHHNASVQVFSEGNDKCRVVWIADLMPNKVAEAIDQMIQQGLNTMKQTLESSPARG